jgi:hypothetical protein
VASIAARSINPAARSGRQVLVAINSKSDTSASTDLDACEKPS